jgi:DMSO/TMAO reductase YedYZ molybdopterin-dependent catalytic subunit
MFGDRGKRRAEKLGIDPARLPPGQSPTLKFPVMTYAGVPAPPAQWSLRIDGEVEAPLTLDAGAFAAQPRVGQTSDFHCVTRWSQFDLEWGGVRVRDVLAQAHPRPGATHVMAHSFDGYTTNLPLEAVLADDALLADTLNGEPLDAEHGGPVRLLVPALYGWKSAKWLERLELMAGDRPGFWERNGYHNNGDPWHEERHSSWR